MSKTKSIKAHGRQINLPSADYHEPRKGRKKKKPMTVRGFRLTDALQPKPKETEK